MKSSVGRVGDEVERNVERPDRWTSRIVVERELQTGVEREPFLNDEAQRNTAEETKLGADRNAEDRIERKLHVLGRKRFEARVERDVPKLYVGRHAEGDQPFSAKPKRREDAHAGEGPHSISGEAELEVLGKADCNAKVHRGDRARRAEGLAVALRLLRPAANHRVEGAAHHTPRHGEVSIRIADAVDLGRAVLHRADRRRLGLLDPVRIRCRTLLVLGRWRIGPVGIGFGPLGVDSLGWLGLAQGWRLGLGLRFDWGSRFARRFDRRAPAVRLGQGGGRLREKGKAENSKKTEASTHDPGHKPIRVPCQARNPGHARAHIARNAHLPILAPLWRCSSGG